jgi:DNA-binding transcriptional regulator LsrR (DeoR family)
LEAGLIAIGREDLGRVLMAIGVAGGPGKVSGILGAVRSGLVNALVTDEETAASRPRLSEAA